MAHHLAIASVGRRGINESDSGRRFIEGSESDEWLNEGSHCVMQQLGHLPQRWPELDRPLRWFSSSPSAHTHTVGDLPGGPPGAARWSVPALP
jgi:hypothetical protein